MEPKNVLKSRIRNSSHVQTLRTFLAEFCRNGNIHGIRYFAERRLHWTERSFWILAIGLSILLCSIFIRNIWTQWNVNQVTISLTETNLPISSIPFPTVTICPETKAYRDKLNVTFLYKQIIQGGNLNDTEKMKFRAISHVCPILLEMLTNSAAIEVLNSEHFTSEWIYEEMKNLSPTLNDSIFICWRPPASSNNPPNPCKTIFTPIFTAEGLCFTFNALNSNEVYTDAVAPELMFVTNHPNVSHWNLENGYQIGSESSDSSEYPIRVFDSYDALVLFVSVFKKDMDFICTGLNQGFRVFLSIPGETPQNSRYFLSVSTSETTRIRIKPRLVITSDGLRNNAPSQRQCFYQSERQLRFFKMYTRNNCKIECLTNFTKIKCGCVHFTMPRDSYTKICGSALIDCYKESERKLFKGNVAHGYERNSVKSFREKCNCLPACDSIQYDADLDRVAIDWTAVAEAYDSNDQKNNFLSRLYVSFKDHEVDTQKRIEVYTYSDFLAICGGLFGLFLGISVLSIIEFVYYSTLHLYWIIRRSRVNNAVVPFEKPNVNTIFQ